MDSFENYLKENRLRLDSEDLDVTCWKEIEASFRQRRLKKLIQRSLVAASIVIVFGLGSTYFLNKSGQNKSIPQSAIFPVGFTDLAKQETSYLQVIGVTEDEIKGQFVPAEYQYLFSDFIQQLHIIDQQYNLYKLEIKKHGYSEELIQQVIYNYQLKLSVLQMLHSEMNKINNLSKFQENENKKIKLNM